MAISHCAAASDRCPAAQGTLIGVVGLVGVVGVVGVLDAPGRVDLVALDLLCPSGVERVLFFRFVLVVLFDGREERFISSVLGEKDTLRCFFFFSLSVCACAVVSDSANADLTGGDAAKFNCLEGVTTNFVRGTGCSCSAVIVFFSELSGVCDRQAADAVERGGDDNRAFSDEAEAVAVLNC